MIIIAHRINTIEGLKNINKKHGVEVDVRCIGNRLILNHEPHLGGEELKDYLKNYHHELIIFNIKEAGIENEVINLARENNIKDYFLLDVEYPFIYRATRIDGFRKIAVRYSEAEPIEFAISHKGLVEWVWIDTNTKLPLDTDSYSRLKSCRFKLCLVSPDRWGRPDDIQKYIQYM
jgi:hypothetical protein